MKQRHIPVLHSLARFVIPPDSVSTRHISMRVNRVDTPEHGYCFSLSACTSEQGDSEDGLRCLQPPYTASFTSLLSRHCNTAWLTTRRRVILDKLDTLVSNQLTKKSKNSKDLKQRFLAVVATARHWTPIQSTPSLLIFKDPFQYYPSIYS
jgi:hypothetical protein